MKFKRICRGLTTLFTAIFAIVLGLSCLAFEAEADVNQIMGTSSYKTVTTDDDGEETDAEYYKKTTSSIDEMMEEKLDIIETVTDEGTVLLKNENDSLPLDGNESVTLFGKASYNPVYGGSAGNAAIGNSGNDNINWTFKRGLENAGFTVNSEMWSYYAGQNLSYDSDPSAEISPDSLPMSSVSSYADAGIVVLSRVTGEGSDASDGYYEVTDTELALIDAAAEYCRKVIVIVNSPSALAIHAIKEDTDVDAILQIGALGSLGTKSIGSVLAGDVSPSGKLVDIYAANSASSAAYQTAGTAAYSNAAAVSSAATSMGIGSGGTQYTVYNEGIYVGYKYYETRYEDTVLGQGNASSSAGVFMGESAWDYDSEVDYSFGYGLSYASFTQEITDFAVEDGIVSVTVRVTNESSVKAKDVVQLYAQSPYTSYDKENGIEKSAVQLMNFGKTGLLSEGESEDVTVTMDLYGIASYDAYSSKTWILDDGTYYFAVGNGAHEALGNILAAKGAEGVSGDSALVCEWENASFDTFEDYEFSSDGFTTEDGLYHNNTDMEVTNRLDDVDLNNLIGSGTTTYLTRSDWENTWPESIQSVTATDDMIADITFSDYESGGAVDDAYTYGADTNYSLIMMKGESYDSEMWDEILNQLMVEEMIATVGENFGAISPILGLNFPGTSDNDGVGSGPCNSYLSEYDTGSTVIDGETSYSSINPRMYPGQTVEAATFNQELIYELGEMMSEDCYYTGMTTLWGPGLNLHRHPYSGRNFEYFSEDSMLTYILGAQITAGVQSNGVICGPKHFAFNDQETDRYGYAVYTNEQAARENSLRGFEGCVSVAKAKNIMTSLNRVGASWVGTNTALQNDILRDEWGFDGYTITDNALETYMCGRSITCGTDKLMLLTGNNRDSELNKTALLADSTLFEAVRTACHRILYVYVNSKAMNGISSNTTIVASTPWWKTALININVILGCAVALGLTGCIATWHPKKKKKISVEEV